MALTIPEELCFATQLSEQELKQEIACMLFSKDKLTLGQAAKLAEMDRVTFQHLLASRKITPHYNVDDFNHDLKVLKEMGRM